jgi:hypothetical protein
MPGEIYKMRKAHLRNVLLHKLRQKPRRNSDRKEKLATPIFFNPGAL